jgi:hypothetical protein
MPVKLGPWVLLDIEKGELPNPCGDCRACCVVLSIDEGDFHKPTMTPCQHLCDAGCAIYSSKPPICTGYYCMYACMADMNGQNRPDKLGVIFSMNDSQSHFTRATGLPLMIAYEVWEGALTSYWGDKLVRKLSQHVPLAKVNYSTLNKRKVDPTVSLITDSTVFLGPSKFRKKVDLYRSQYAEHRRKRETL